MAVCTHTCVGNVYAYARVSNALATIKNPQTGMKAITIKKSGKTVRRNDYQIVIVRIAKLKIAFAMRANDSRRLSKFHSNSMLDSRQRSGSNERCHLSGTLKGAFHTWYAYDVR